MVRSLRSGSAPQDCLNCVFCELDLPLRDGRPGEQVSKWVCVQCGAAYEAVFLEDAPRAIATNAIRHKSAEAARPTAPSAPRHESPAPRQQSTVAASSRRTAKCSLHTGASTRIDRQADRRGALSVHSEGPPLLASVTKPETAPYSEEDEAVITEQVHDSLQHMDQLIETLERGRSIDGQAHEAIARDTIVQATRDLDLYVKLGINPAGNGYPGAHSLHVAMLAVAVGANLGWDRETLLELGVGCLIHDLGMISVCDRVHETPRLLGEQDFEEIVKHPLLTFDLLEDHLDAVPLASRMVAYQIHERLDGQGYPRNRPAAQIHQAAKVAALADVYMALVSPRPHRPAVWPHHAIMYLVYGARDGQFDPTSTRALLKTISIYPIGSWASLGDGRVARVLRSSPSDYTKPIVEAWRADERDAPPVIIDLSKNHAVKIARPIEEPLAIAVA